MKVKQLHGWDMGSTEAIELQKKLSTMISRKNELTHIRYIAGTDISVRKAENTATGAVVLLNYPELTIIETSVVTSELTFPYIPGLLSFREMPVMLKAFAGLRTTPDLIIVDGQGIAHPRRFGLAAHLGLVLDIPAIGCAKSRLCGSYVNPDTPSGSYTYLTDNEETIGAVLRTRTGVKPLFISSGHKTDLKNAVQWTMNCCRGYRLPEPTRLAHLAAGGNLTDRKIESTGR